MLTDLQKKFCVEYSRCGNATQAYTAAGYKAKGNAVRVNASRLLTNADVRKYIAELSSEIRKSKIMDAEERQGVLTEVIEQGMKTGNYKAVCKAVDILNKMQGSYVNKLEIGGPDGGPLEFSWAGGDGG